MWICFWLCRKKNQVFWLWKWRQWTGLKYRFYEDKNLNGPNNDLNMIPVHIKTKSEKANNINFLANGGFFKLKVSYRPNKQTDLLYFIAMQNSHIENIELENKLAYNYYWNKFNKYLSLDFIEVNDLIDYSDPEEIC